MTNQAQPHRKILCALAATFRGFAVLERMHTSLDNYGKQCQVAIEEMGCLLKWMQSAAARKLFDAAHGGDLSGFQARPSLAQAVFVTSEPVTMNEARHSGEDLSCRAERSIIPIRWASGVHCWNFGKKYPNMTEKLVAAVRKGWSAYLENPNAVNVHMAASLNADMSVETMNIGAKIAETYVRPPHPLKLGEMSTARWQALGAQLRGSGQFQARFLRLKIAFLMWGWRPRMNKTEIKNHMELLIKNMRSRAL